MNFDFRLLEAPLQIIRQQDHLDPRFLNGDFSEMLEFKLDDPKSLHQR